MARYRVVCIMPAHRMKRPSWADYFIVIGRTRSLNSLTKFLRLLPWYGNWASASTYQDAVPMCYMRWVRYLYNRNEATRRKHFGPRKYVVIDTQVLGRDPRCGDTLTPEELASPGIFHDGSIT